MSKTPRGEVPIKVTRGVRMLRVPNFVKNYTIGCANLPKNYTAGYAIFIHKGLHSKITETACISMLALKINYSLGSAF